MSADGLCHIKARVRATPEKGAANEALEKLIANWLGMPRRNVKLIAGGTSRLKTVRISGDPVRIAADIDTCLGKLRR